MNADKITVNAPVDRSVDQGPVDRVILQVRECRMRIGGGIAPGRQSIYHALSPGIAAEDPVEASLLQLQVGRISRELPVPVALDRKAYRKIIAAPDKGDGAIEGVMLCFFPYPFDAFFVETDHRIFSFILEEPGQFIMTGVDEGIPLVMPGR